MRPDCIAGGSAAEVGGLLPPLVFLVPPPPVASDSVGSEWWWWCWRWCRTSVPALVVDPEPLDGAIRAPKGTPTEVKALADWKRPENAEFDVLSLLLSFWCDLNGIFATVSSPVLWEQEQSTGIE